MSTSPMDTVASINKFYSMESYYSNYGTSSSHTVIPHITDQKDIRAIILGFLQHLNNTDLVSDNGNSAIGLDPEIYEKYQDQLYTIGVSFTTECDMYHIHRLNTGNFLVTTSMSINNPITYEGKLFTWDTLSDFINNYPKAIGMIHLDLQPQRRVTIYNNIVGMGTYMGSVVHKEVEANTISLITNNRHVISRCYSGTDRTRHGIEDCYVLLPDRALFKRYWLSGLEVKANQYYTFLAELVNTTTGMVFDLSKCISDYTEA